MLELVTFTGVDAHTDLAELARIASEYPQAEFGSSQDPDRRCSPHLPAPRHRPGAAEPGRREHLPAPLRQIRPDGRRGTYAPHSLTLLCNGFGRVQVNLHGDAENPEGVQVRATGVQHFART